METVSVALDWTPNANHTGFFVAQNKGYYAENGLTVHLLSPHTDNYHQTPASKLRDKLVSFAVTPSETVISSFTQPDPTSPKLQAVASLLQHSTSAIVTLKSSGIDHPIKLEGKKYASYGARYEGRIVQQLIKNAGGVGEYQEMCPPMLGIWNTLLNGTADATWVFLGWEGIEAQMKNVELNVFKLEDYGIPYGYSPLLVSTEELLRDKPSMVRRFLAATAKGYQYAAKHPEEAAELLLQQVAVDTTCPPLPTPLELPMVSAAQVFTSPYYLAEDGCWGHMKPEKWDTFLDWLSSSGLLTTKMQSRTSNTANYTTLDGLRQGDVGEEIPRSQVQSTSLYTNNYLA